MAKLASIPLSPATFVRSQTIDEVMMHPREAARLISLIYDNQRPIIERHVRVFADLYLHGAWRETSMITVIVARKTGIEVVVNGAHRLNFIARSPHPIGVTVRKIIVDDSLLLDEAEREYRIHDTNTKNRSVKDLLWSHETVRALGLDPHVADQVAAAAHFIELGFPVTSSGVDAKNRSADMRVPSLVKYVNAGKELLEYLSAAPKSSDLYKAFIRKAGMAAGIAICSRFPNDPKAREFFYTVSRDDGLGADDPRKVLVRLISNKFKNSSGKTYGDAAKAILVRKAFDAFVAGDKVSYFRVTAENELNAAAIINA